MKKATATNLTPNFDLDADKVKAVDFDDVEIPVALDEALVFFTAASKISV